MRARRTACVVFVCVCAGFGSAQSSKSFVFAACCFIIAFRFKNPLVSWNCREEPKSETELRRLYNTLTYIYLYKKHMRICMCIPYTTHRFLWLRLRLDWPCGVVRFGGRRGRSRTFRKFEYRVPVTAAQAHTAHPHSIVASTATRLAYHGFILNIFQKNWRFNQIFRGFEVFLVLQSLKIDVLLV